MGEPTLIIVFQLGNPVLISRAEEASSPLIFSVSVDRRLVYWFSSLLVCNS